MRLPPLAKTWGRVTRSTSRAGYDSAPSVEMENLTPQPYDPFFADGKSPSSVSKLSLDSTPPPPTNARRWWPFYTQGWRFGAANCSISVIVVFFVNLVVTIWGSARKNAPGEVIFSGECNHISRINSYLHLLINLLSTLMLSSSNYCMQCLSAPTRKEVDSAHAKGVWLDIGIPSIRNLRFISKRRAVAWCLLGLSSLPLHLL